MQLTAVQATCKSKSYAPGIPISYTSQKSVGSKCIPGFTLTYEALRGNQVTIFSTDRGRGRLIFRAHYLIIKSLRHGPKVETHLRVIPIIPYDKQLHLVPLVR